LRLSTVFINIQESNDEHKTNTDKIESDAVSAAAVLRGRDHDVAFGKGIQGKAEAIH
jgi:hypothetical protein